MSVPVNVPCLPTLALAVSMETQQVIPPLCLSQRLPNPTTPLAFATRSGRRTSVVMRGDHGYWSWPHNHQTWLQPAHALLRLSLPSSIPLVSCPTWLRAWHRRVPCTLHPGVALVWLDVCGVMSRQTGNPPSLTHTAPPPISATTVFLAAHHHIHTAWLPSLTLTTPMESQATLLDPVSGYL